MKKTIPTPMKMLEEISQMQFSGSLVISDINDKSVGWKLYLNDDKIQYATSTVGKKERLVCLLKTLIPPNLSVPEFISEEFEYDDLYAWLYQQDLRPSELQKIIVLLTMEAFVQVISFEEVAVEIIDKRILSKPVINLDWRELSKKMEKSIGDRQRFRLYGLSFFNRLYLENKDMHLFYRVWKKLHNINPFSEFVKNQKMSFWIEILSKKVCLYELSVMTGVKPLNIIKYLQPFFQAKLIQILPFKEESKQTSIEPGYRPVVACIDDNKTVQIQVKKTLESVGYEVVSITDPCTSLIALARQRPALILMDINMPELDGYELCTILNRSSKLRNVPIVMLTGREGIVDRIKARLHRATHYLTKPVKPNELIETVNNLACCTA
ncbi:MAG: response regulator [Prochloraceae cyanobacterium]|nr:response regulator [Prochloraceae cyanobacterium]